MFEYRQIIVRMRLEDSDRALARADLTGRPKSWRCGKLPCSTIGWIMAFTG